MVGGRRIKNPLSQLLLCLARDYDIRVTLIVREQDVRSDRVINPLATSKPSHLTVQEIPLLHAKVLLTEAFVLETSANLLWTSLFRNVESCTLATNPYNNPRQWVKVKLGLII